MKNRILLMLLFVCSFYSILAQQSCSEAVEISFLEYSTCGQIAITSADLADAAPSEDYPSPECGNFSTTTNDLWYKIVTPLDVNELAFHVINPGMLSDPYVFFRPALAVYSGLPGNLELLQCFYDEGGPFSNGEIRFSLITNLTPGQTIYLRVWDMNNNPFPFFIAASVRTEIPEYNCNTPEILSDGGCNILAPEGTIDAPEKCGWNTSDNTCYFSFVVNPSDPQPVTIGANYVFCFENGGTYEYPDNTVLQMAIYSWNGYDCSWLGGSPQSMNPNDSTYWGCNSGTGVVSISALLDPGLYVLALDGYRGLSGTSLCTFEFSSNIANQFQCHNDTIICYFSPPVNLGENLPQGGVWEPSQFVNDGIFNPAEPGDGIWEIIYSLGGYTCSSTISVASYPVNISDIEICLVSVDENNKNRILWEKPDTDSLQAFHIYKDNGVAYDLIGSVPYEHESYFVDYNSEPQTQSFRYKIAGYSVCEFESELSDYHQTILLNMVEESGTWHLSWTPYIGAEVGSINVLRGTNPSDLITIASFDAETTEFTDTVPPAGFVYYQIEVILTVHCNVEKSVSVVRSNISTNDPDYFNTGIGMGVRDISNKICPNPAGNSFSLCTGSMVEDVFIFNIHGEKVRDIRNYKNQIIDVSELEKGIYFVRIIGNEEVGMGKLIIE
ncbi:MAG: T9SS type A sorting domain-containing protein [Bacteroidales bacterium]|nr:T9SS type A sorting domain-containing protein [Bacteroidales bacterium]